MFFSYSLIIPFILYRLFAFFHSFIRIHLILLRFLLLSHFAVPIWLAFKRTTCKCLTHFLLSYMFVVVAVERWPWRCNYEQFIWTDVLFHRTLPLYERFSSLFQFLFSWQMLLLLSLPSAHFRCCIYLFLTPFLSLSLSPPPVIQCTVQLSIYIYICVQRI